MSGNPKTLQDLGSYWTSHGGVNLGVVGNTSHTYGYHLGKDRIYDGSGPGVGDADYSVKTARDRAGLTNMASAIDLGKLNGSLANLQKFSRWLVARAQHNATGTRDLREIIYSPDGKTVLRWDRERGYASTPRAGEADNTHLTHTHISFYRDSEARDKRPIFAPYFTPAPPPVQESDMPALTAYIPGQVATVKVTANVRVAPSLTATILRVVSGTPEVWTVTGWVKGDVDPDGGSDQWVCRWSSGRWEYTAKSNITAGPAVPPDGSPFTQAQLDAAVAAAGSKGYNDGLGAASAAVAAVPRK